MPADKVSIITDSLHIRTVKEPVTAAARVQGDPFLLNGVLVIPMETVAIGKECLHCYQADAVEVTAQAANAQIASVNFNALLQKIYWDAAASKITNVVGANTLIGRLLELKDFSAGVAINATLKIEFNPNV